MCSVQCRKAWLNMVLLGETGAACLEPLGLRCFCAFAGLLKHHKITEGDSEIVDIALHPQFVAIRYAARTENWIMGQKNSSCPVASASYVYKATNCLPPEEVL